jgi:hypothetical protein
MIMATKISDPGIGNENADAGSEEWAKYWRLAMQTALKNANFDQERVLVLWEHGKQHRAWTKLNRKDGGTFKQWEEFVSDALPWGLGSKPESVRAILESRKGYRSTQRETVPEPRTKWDESTPHDGELSINAQQRLRAINRAPEIVGKLYDEGLISQVDAAKLGKKGIDTVEVAGELAKVVEETKACECIKEKKSAIKPVVERLVGGRSESAYDKLVKLWAKTTDAERTRFLVEVVHESR